MREVLALLAEHAATGLDYVSLCILLNTVAGGHYEERFAEDDLRAILQAALDYGWVEAGWIDAGRVEAEGGEAGTAAGGSRVTPELALRPGGGRLHLTSSGREALTG